MVNLLSSNVSENNIWKAVFFGFQTLGSIYGSFHVLEKAKLGDIGTSPLYVFSAYVTVKRHLKPRIFPRNVPSHEEILGATSCIVWCLTLVPLIKYSWILLHASNEDGEGISTIYLFQL
jgi:KUP system potassium uptake protein